eukprot:CFRG4528T1
MSTNTSSQCVGEDGEIQNPTLAAFLTALGFNTLLSVAFVTIFLIFRARCPKLYSPRELCIVENDVPKLPRTYFSWIPQFWRYGDDDILAAAGLDALMLYRVVKMFAYCFALFLPFGCIVLIPLNAINGIGLIELDMLTMGNVEPSSAKFIAHVVSVYYFTLVVMYMLHREYTTYIVRRQRTWSEKADYTYSCMVKQIPIEDQTEESLTSAFSILFPDKVKHAVMHYNPGDCESLFEERDIAMRNLERALWIRETTGELPKHKVGFLGMCGEQVDSIDYWSEELKRLNNELADEQANLKTTTGSGFVTFNNMQSPAVAGQVLFRESENMYLVRPAPHENNVYWSNMGTNERVKVFRVLGVALITFAMVIFYMIPIAFIQTLTSLCQLEEWMPWLTDIIDAVPIVRGILEGVMPTLILTIFLAILPMICRGLTVLEGKETYSALEKGTFEKLYYFYVINVFLGSTITGTASGAIQDLIDDPGSIIDLLAASLPGVSTFFINYIMLKTAESFPGMLSNIVGGVIYWIKMKWLAKTPRERADVWFPTPNFSYAQSYGDVMLVFIIGITYATMASLIIPFSLVYFLFAMFAFKYEVMYASQPTPDYEGNGEFFPMVFNRTMFSLILYQVVMFGYLGIKQSFLAAFVVPLIPCAIIFWFVENNWFSRPAAYLPLQCAFDIDSETHDGDKVPEFRRDTYIQECLRSKPIHPFGAENPFHANYNKCQKIEREEQKKNFRQMWDSESIGETEIHSRFAVESMDEQLIAKRNNVDKEVV